VGPRAKEKAIDQGLREGVVRVARELLDAERAADEAAQAEAEAIAALMAALAEGPAGEVGAGLHDALGSAEALEPGGGQAEETGSVGKVESTPEGAEAAEAALDPFSPGYGRFPLPGPPDPEAEAQARLAEEALAAERRALAAQTRRISKALGREMVAYTKSFRIVEDQGERQALFSDDPDVLTEYVVLLEVQVEVERVRARLEEAGALRPQAASLLTGIRLEVYGLSHYGGYSALLELLSSDAVGAAAVSPLDFARGRVVLQVEGEWGPEQLMERLRAAAPPNLRLQGPGPGDLPAPLGWRPDSPGPRGAGRLVLRAAWAPLPPPGELGAETTQ